MNSKEEMRALADNIEYRYNSSKNESGSGRVMVLYHHELPVIAAALRASAAPEEGMISVDALRQTIANEWGSHLCYTDDTGYRRQCDPVGGRCRCADIARAIISTHALPSDSGLAAPVTGHPVERLWRAVGLPEYFLGNGGSNTKLYELYAAIRNELHADLRALAPATEIEALRAGLQLRIDQINPLVTALEKAREYVASFPYSAGSPAYLKQCSTLIEIDRALSPPSVGTPAQPSAQSKSEAE